MSSRSDADEDIELFAMAKKSQSLKNLQSLEIHCMKAIIKQFNFDLAPSLKNLCKQKLSMIPNILFILIILIFLPATCLKNTFLELLLQLAKQEKSIPLNLDQKVQLIKILLNKTVKHFDFEILKIPSFILKEEPFLAWEKSFDDLWTELAEKCPNLLSLREMRPCRFAGFPENKLNSKVFNFTKLNCLRTNSFIDPGLISII